jgi:drug/metabolite transporter (DMT)-like permease
MIFLLLSILSSTAIAVIFKLIDKKNVALFPVIILNYVAAFVVGVLLFDGEISMNYIVQSSWFGISMMIGLLLIAGFYLIGYSTQKAGIAVTVVANKMSVIIPMGFSIVRYAEKMSALKTAGIVLTLVAVLLAVYKKREASSGEKFSLWPLLMFFVIGIIDSSVKLAQQDYVPETDVSLFTAFSFGISGVIGLMIMFFKIKTFKHFSEPPVWFYGILIGLVNFGSLYFIILALSHSGMDSSIVYGMNNMGVILLSITLAVTVFSEKLSRINIVGVVLAILAALILTVLV